MREDYKKALKAVVFAQSFVEALDEFGGTTAFKHQLKQKGVSFAKEVDKFLNTVYKDGSTDSALINVIERCQQAIDEVVANEVEVID